VRKIDDADLRAKILKSFDCRLGGAGDPGLHAVDGVFPGDSDSHTANVTGEG
jgi:hypothetical protein